MTERAMQAVVVDSFEDWRTAARSLVSGGVPPEAVDWRVLAGPQRELSWDDSAAPDGAHAALPRRVSSALVAVPPQFLRQARLVACHRDVQRWALLYRLLWRLVYETGRLLEIAVDDDVIRLNRMARAVARDAHKAQAFARFRRIEDAEGAERFVAWHRPDHRILRLVAPFFVRRFKSMRWSLLTPDESAMWDGVQLAYGPGMPAGSAPRHDALDDMWRTYYRSIFNPARIKLDAMRREMPVRYWAALPETEVIPEMLAEAPRRVARMVDRPAAVEAATAAEYLPAQRDWNALAAAAVHCRGCALYGRATQTVFGRGPTPAQIMLVGEQPGDQEDLHGEPFIGLAGRVLNDALEAAGVRRDSVYITNAVKHFHWEPRGARRIHAKPPSRAVAACQPWLRAELAAVAPQSLVCLGVTAAQAVLGRDTRQLKQRGAIFATAWSPRTIITWHPAAILRARREADRLRMRQELTQHLRQAVQSCQEQASLDILPP